MNLESIELQELTEPAPIVEVPRLDMPCRYCEHFNSAPNTWWLESGEVDAIECANCYAGATKDVWNQPILYRGFIIRIGVTLPLMFEEVGVKNGRSGEARSLAGCRSAINAWLAPVVLVDEEPS